MIRHKKFNRLLALKSQGILAPVKESMTESIQSEAIADPSSDENSCEEFKINVHALKATDESNDRKALNWILIAEDQLVNIEVMRMHLDDMGLTSRSEFCFNGREALQLAEQKLNEAVGLAGSTQQRIKPISLMLLDFQMPVMNGIDLYHQVKAMFQDCRKQHKHLEITDPVFVFLTAFATTNFCKHLRSLGVEYIYEKPVSKEVLEKILAEID